MNRRTLLKRTGGVGIAALGLGTTTASADEKVVPDACLVCQEEPCPEGCNDCVISEWC